MQLENIGTKPLCDKRARMMGNMQMGYIEIEEKEG
jgi:hypothetical protein